MQGFCIFIKNIMYERKHQQLASRPVFYRRMGKSILIAFFFLIIFLGAGTLGYYCFIPHFGWYNSFLNASMILSGMGPMIDPPFCLDKSAKVFASVYAIFSGVAFLSIFGLLIAPVLHRFFHQFHLDK